MCSAKKKGIMLFGVRLTAPDNNPSSFRKSFSLNNLSQYKSQKHIPNAGYTSDNVVHPSPRIADCKRGVPWSEEEHRLFLLGLQNVGKGDWKGISRNFVKTRTPTQVASHAQKYFLRCRHTQNRCRCRRRQKSSLFDITTDSVMLQEEEQAVASTKSKPDMAELEIADECLNLF